MRNIKISRVLRGKTQKAKTKAFLCVLAVALTLVVALAGCGGKKSSGGAADKASESGDHVLKSLNEG